MKRLLPLLAVAALVAVPVASAMHQSSVPVKKPGKLIVAFGDPTPGFAVGKVRGTKISNPKGYEVDLAKKIAALWHLTPVWVYTPWTSLFAPGVKKFDVSFQEATITPQRKKTVDFTTSYFDANQGVLLSKKATPPKSLADLKKLQTCAQADTTGLDFIKSKLHPDKQPLVYQTTTAAFTAVQIGRCEALILDTPIVASQKKAKPSAYGAVGGQIVTHEQYGAVLQKGSKLTTQLNTGIKKLWANGTIARLQKKWFNLDFSKLPDLK